MIELAQHIEALLLENDCVIIPGFGGFITHYTSAFREEKENLFLPPVRSIGFNPHVKLNDGLLVQSYMRMYNTSFADATCRVERATEYLTNKLYEEGKIELPNIGEIRYTMRQSHEFTPFDHKLTTPILYGLDAFEMKKLHALPKAVTPAINKQEAHTKEKREFRINYAYVGNVAAAIAIIALFFGFSIPIENTYIESRNYAQLLPSDLFEKIESKSLVFTPVITKKNTLDSSLAKEATASTSSTKTTAKPINIPSDNRVSAPINAQTNTIEQQPTNGDYHIIVAGGVMQKNAEAMVSQLQAKGFDQACVLNCNGLIRVSLMSFSTGTEATNKMLKLRENEEFKNAWMLANK